MKKKVLALIIVLVIAVGLFVGCSGPSSPSFNGFEGKVPENFAAMNASNKDTTYSAKSYANLAALDLGEGVSVSADLGYGFIRVTKLGDKAGATVSRYGIYSLELEKIVVPIEYDSVYLYNPNITVNGTSTTFNNSTNGYAKDIGYYAVAETTLALSPTSYGVFSLSEENKAVVSFSNAYISNGFSVTREQVMDYEKSGTTTVYKTYEKVSTESINPDTTKPNVKTETFREVIKDKGTGKITAKNNVTGNPMSTHQAGSNLNDHMNTTNLGAFSKELEGYRTRTVVLNGRTTMEVFNKEGKSVASILIPVDLLASTPGDLVKTIIVGKNLMYQEAFLLADDANNHTYVAPTVIGSGAKFKLLNTRVDLTNGRITESEADMHITNWSAKLDKDEKTSFAVASGNRIVNKQIDINDSSYIIDCNFKAVANVSDTAFSEAPIKLSNDRYLAEECIVDANYNIITYLTGCSNYKTGFDTLNNRISLSRGGYYGVIDFDGKIIVPFEYTESFVFYDGVAQSTHKDDGKVLVTKEGVVTTVKSMESATKKVYTINKGLYAVWTEGTTRNTVQIFNNAGTALTSYETTANATGFSSSSAIYVYSTADNKIVLRLSVYDATAAAMQTKYYVVK